MSYRPRNSWEGHQLTWEQWKVVPLQQVVCAGGRQWFPRACAFCWAAEEREAAPALCPSCALCPYPPLTSSCHGHRDKLGDVWKAGKPGSGKRTPNGTTDGGFSAAAGTNELRGCLGGECHRHQLSHAPFGLLCSRLLPPSVPDAVPGAALAHPLCQPSSWGPALPVPCNLEVLQ